MVRSSEGSSPRFEKNYLFKKKKGPRPTKKREKFFELA